MYTWLSLEVVQCRQFDPVSGPFSMNNKRNEDAASVYSISSRQNLVAVKSKRAYFRKKKAGSKLVIILLVFLVTSLIVTVVVMSVLYMREKRHNNLCDSEACVKIAASLKELMDPTVDPCDDFYTYVCGRWSQEHPMPESTTTHTWFDERASRVIHTIRDLLRKNLTENAPQAVAQAQILYNSCLDTSAMDDLGLAPLFALLEELTIPAVPASFTKETSSYIRQLAMLKRTLGVDLFFGFSIFPDPRNKTKNVMMLDLPEVRSPFPSDKELQKRLQSIKSRLLRNMELDDTEVSDTPSSLTEKLYIKRTIQQVLSNGTHGPCATGNDSYLPPDDRIDDVVEELFQITGTIFFLAHGNGNQSLSDIDIDEDDYMLVDEIQRITDEYVLASNSSLVPKTIWRPFLEELFRGKAELDLNRRDKILVDDIDFLKIIALLISSADEEALETVIWWTVVDIVVPYSTGKLREIWTDYLEELMDAEIRESRSLNCASAVNQLMGAATSWLFVEPTFHKEKGEKVKEMLEDIRRAFSILVYKTDWMDVQTKKATLLKNQKMTSFIGHPTWLFVDGKLDEYYEGIDLKKTTYLDNMLQIVRKRSSEELETVHDYNWKNSSSWATDATDVNAFHTFQDNQITVPAGILQFPFYELGLEALNYGAIGTILGHELTHGFDNNGRQFDENGNLRQWWTNETISEYTERTECFIEHYNTYYEEEVDDYVNGELTLGENIADNGGLREAVYAYRNWKARHGQEPLLPGFTHLSHEQLLFLSFGHIWCESYTPTSLRWLLEDSHCPGHVRLRAVLRNSKEFSDTWNCPLGSNMNPSKKCRLW